MIYRLKNPVKRYAWGSPTLLPEFLGLRNPGGGPWAELWMGAHPSDPSLVETPDGPVPLGDFVAGDPAAVLGKAPSEKFSGGLPFLFKVLAADSPLSIQCHPDLARAKAGFAKENERGLAPYAPERNYRDGNHKPEILAALTPFDALRGFRGEEEILRFFSSFPPALRSLAESAIAPGSAGLRPFFARLLGLPRREAGDLIEAALDARRDSVLPEDAWFRRLAALHPGDPGCFAPFYLNLVRLAPGEALFLGPGELHAYLGGLAVELMANSDNVLRGGLTSKRVDLGELLEVAVFSPAPPEILTAGTMPLGKGCGERSYPVRAAEFRLSAVVCEGNSSAALETESAEILLAVEGCAALRTDRCGLELKKGESVFVPASVGRIEMEGTFTLFRAGIPV